MTTPQATRPDIDAIEARHRAARPGPYQWRGNVHSHWTPNGLTPIRSGHIDLWGRDTVFVMGFKRFGMTEAQPTFNTNAGMRPASEFMQQPEYWNGWKVVGIDHPDAIAIEHSWQDREDLLTYIRHLESQRAQPAQALPLTAEELRVVSVLTDRMKFAENGKFRRLPEEMVYVIDDQHRHYHLCRFEDLATLLSTVKTLQASQAAAETILREIFEDWEGSGEYALRKYVDRLRALLRETE